MYVRTYLIFGRDSEVLDLHLPPAVSWEEELRNTSPGLAVHDRHAPPISAHPDLVPPYGKAGAGGVVSAV